MRPLRFARLVLHDWGPAREVPLRTRLRAWRWRFHARNYVLYDLDRNDPRLYVRDGIYLHYFLNDVHIASLNNKLSFARHMERFGMPHPRLLAFVNRGRVHPIGDFSFSAGSVRDAIPPLLEKHGAFVAKPVVGGAGTGLLLVRRDGARLDLNGVQGSIDDLVALLENRDDVLVTEFADSHEYARALFPKTSNTLRILTLWDFDRNEPFVAAAVHRIGATRSLPVDNFHQGRGGLSAPIDLATGKLGVAATFSQDLRVSWHDRHPETGAAIEGVVVPDWQSVLRDVLAIAERFPHIPCIGWDLIVTPDSVSVLEANCPPGMAVWQVHGPILADPRARRLFDELHWT